MSNNQKEPRGVCYICNGDCNPCSQTCGSCARDLTMVMIGMKNTDNVKPDVEKYLESLYNEPTVNTLSTDNFPREQDNLMDSFFNQKEDVLKLDNSEEERKGPKE